MMKKAAVPDDPRFSEWQWNLFAPTSTYTGGFLSGNATKSAVATGGANLPVAWDISKGGASDVVVAIIDTGIVNHPDLNALDFPAPYTPNGRFVAGYDFISFDVGAGTVPSFFVANDGDGRDPDPTDPGDWVTSAQEAQYPDFCDDGVLGPQNSSWHGTHMAGIAAAAANNGVGIAGIGWNVRVQPIRALGRCGGSLSDIGEAIRWAAGLDVPGLPRESDAGPGHQPEPRRRRPGLFRHYAVGGRCRDRGRLRRRRRDRQRSQHHADLAGQLHRGHRRHRAHDQRRERRLREHRRGHHHQRAGRWPARPARRRRQHRRRQLERLLHLVHLAVRHHDSLQQRRARPDGRRLRRLHRHERGDSPRRRRRGVDQVHPAVGHVRAGPRLPREHGATVSCRQRLRGRRRLRRHVRCGPARRDGGPGACIARSAPDRRERAAKRDRHRRAGGDLLGSRPRALPT